ncbi:MAG: NusG domain II-containing protein [Ruminococcaceae bacterium]|nr:NusG domain II-containing protein [Oscillospiraceae bacterium]
MKMFQTKPTRADLVAMILILLLATGMLLLPSWFSSNASVLVITTPEGRFEYSLSEPRELTLTSNGVTLRVVIADGAAYVSESNCRDGVCRNSGKISGSGETILCAPAGITLSVKGGGRDVDFVAG